MNLSELVGRTIRKARGFSYPFVVGYRHGYTLYDTNTGRTEAVTDVEFEYAIRSGEWRLVE